MKRFLSFLLVLALLMTLVPVFAFADKTVEMKPSQKIFDLIKGWEGAILDEDGNHVAYLDTNTTIPDLWTIGYGHTGYVPCKDANVEEGMTLTKEEAEELLWRDLNEIYGPSVNKFVRDHKDLYPDGFTQNEFDALVSLAFGFGAYWIDYYKDSYRICKYLLNGVNNYSDEEIADAIGCLWSNLPGLLYRRVTEARIFLYGDYDGTGEHQLAYLRFQEGGKVFSDTTFPDHMRSGNAVAVYIVGSSYGMLPTAKDSDEKGYFVGWKTTEGRILKSSEVVKKSMTVTPVWSDTRPVNYAQYFLTVEGGSGSGFYTAGSKVTIAPSPRSEYAFIGWEGDLEAFSNGDGTYTVTIPTSNCTITAKRWTSGCKYGDLCPSKAFVDVPEDFWAHGEIDEAVRNGIFKGTSNITFEPDTPMNRGMLVTVLHRISGSPGVEVPDTPPFADLPDDWSRDGILWAASKHIANGYEDGTFRHEELLTRAELATFLCRYSNYLGYNSDYADHANLSGYTDAEDVPEWAREAMSWAVANGVILGTSNTTLSPNDCATRAQVAVMLIRFLKIF